MKIVFVALDQPMDTTQRMGRLIFHMLAAFAEFEWSLRKERQAEGLAKAKQRGVQLGRWVKLTEWLVQSVRQSRTDGLKSKADPYSFAPKTAVPPRLRFSQKAMFLLHRRSRAQALIARRFGKFSGCRNGAK